MEILILFHFGNVKDGIQGVPSSEESHKLTHNSRWSLKVSLKDINLRPFNS